MSDISCSTVRRWLQAPDALALIDARHMDRHLAVCAACDEYRHRQIEMDRLIVNALDGAVGASTVHAAVRARLDTLEPQPKAKRHVATPRWARALFRPTLVIAPIAVAAAIVLAIFPQLVNKRAVVTPVSAAWHVRRPTIAYPLTIDPRRPQHLLVGAWGQVYQSWNAGQTWQQLAPLPGDLIIRDLAVDSAHPNRYLVATKHSILLSSDAGRHWTQTAANLRGAENMFLMQDRTHAQTFYVGPSVLWKSADGGLTWQQDGRGAVFAPNGIQALTIAPTGALYTGIWGGGVAVSHDGGVTWQRRARGLNPDVLSVTIGATGRLWAATARGIYTSSNAGVIWRRRSPSHLFATSVVETGSVLLAGGDGAVYRSTDAGRHWVRAESGLPLDPYVYALTADIHSPGRVYASLNGDGIFRSDDAGQTWQEMNAGLPISRQEGKASPVLFLRHGVLWHTDSGGSDPGNLTVDTTVLRAALTPDGAAAAYLATTSGGWAVRIVSSGGSGTHTIMTGSGALPDRLLWSPTGTRVLAIARTGVRAADLSGRHWAWTLAPGEHVLGWTKDGLGLLVWNAPRQTVEDRTLASGTVLGRWPGSYPAPPLRAPDQTTLSMVVSSSLRIGTIGAPLRTVAHVRACAPSTWSDDGKFLLLACAGSVEIRSATGALVDRVRAPANARFAPSADTRLLYFARGSLWAWTKATGARIIVPNAGPAS